MCTLYTHKSNIYDKSCKEAWKKVALHKGQWQGQITQ